MLNEYMVQCLSLECAFAYIIIIGCSTYPLLFQFDADVLGCIRIGSEVAVVDTWNPTALSPGQHINVLDATQTDLSNTSTAFVNGKIFCK